jgi:hypothetical protein
MGGHMPKMDCLESRNSARNTGRDEEFSIWVSAAVVLGSLLMIAGAVIALVNPAMLASSKGSMDGAVRVYAAYLFSRNVALAAALLIALVLRSRRAVGILMLLVSSIQLLDAVMDCAEGRWAIVPGVLLFGGIFALGAARLGCFRRE